MVDARVPPRAGPWPLGVEIDRTHSGGANPAAAEMSERTTGQICKPDAPSHQLTEALTAIGNYLAVANHILTKKSESKPDALHAVIQKSLTQYSRAVVAIRKINGEIHRAEKGSDLLCLADILSCRRERM